MSLTLIKPYFRTRLYEVDSAFKEWTDGFNIGNIPANIYDKAYHIRLGGFDGGDLGGKAQFVSAPVDVRLFFKGYRNVSENIDRGLLLAEGLIAQVQDPADRLGSTLKNIKFNSMSIDESFITNDNLILILQNYIVTIILCAGG